MHDLSIDELRVLSRQHTFAGYSRPEEEGKLGNGMGGGEVIADPLVICRRHAIDWNYHPDFPRSRPNKWRVEYGLKGQSFKVSGSAAFQVSVVHIPTPSHARNTGVGLR